LTSAKNTEYLIGGISHSNNKELINTKIDSIRIDIDERPICIYGGLSLE
jgi:hypothetical protein